MGGNSISFYGYHDGKAIEIYNCINLFLPTMVSILASLFFTILAFVLHNLYLLVFWIGPAILGSVYLLCISMTGYHDKTFLSGTRKKHIFIVDHGNLIRDGKPIKKAGLKVYAFKNFVFLITQKTYYRIPNEAFIGITREEFLQFMKTTNQAENQAMCFPIWKRRKTFNGGQLYEDKNHVKAH